METLVDIIPVRDIIYVKSYDIQLKFLWSRKKILIGARSDSSSLCAPEQVLPLYWSLGEESKYNNNKKKKIENE